MGFERYDIWLIDKNVERKINEDGYYYFSGMGSFDKQTIINSLKTNNYKWTCLDKSNNYVLNDLFEISFIEKNSNVQAIIFSGSISWINEGISDAYSSINNITYLFDFSVEIAGSIINTDSLENFTNQIITSNEWKIKAHNQSFKGFKAKIPPNKYYQYYEHKTRRMWDKVLGRKGC